MTISNQLLEVAVKNKESLRPLVEKNLQAIEIIRHAQKLPMHYDFPPGAATADIAETILNISEAQITTMLAPQKHTCQILWVLIISSKYAPPPSVEHDSRTSRRVTDLELGTL